MKLFRIALCTAAVFMSVVSGCMHTGGGGVLSLDRWTYIMVDSTRTQFDILAHGWERWFGMDVGDLTGDGYGDIVAGKWFYKNPGGDMTGEWHRTILKDTVDALFIVDVDGDDRGDVIAIRCNEQFWFEAEDPEGGSWKAVRIGTNPICNHGISAQGYCKAQVIAGGRQELLISDLPGVITCIEIPEHPEGEWPAFVITRNGTEKFMAAGDLDGDGDEDIVTACKNGKYYSGILWFENRVESRKSAEWQGFPIGETEFKADQFGIADLNGDERPDIVVTEGRSPEAEPAHVFWFEQPEDVKNGSWTRHTIAVQYSTNSLSLADMDRDGDIDIVTAEHKGSLRLQIWQNDGSGRFNEHVIDWGKENHNGARVFDFDGDGDLDISGSGWYAHQYVHLWRNDAIRR